LTRPMSRRRMLRAAAMLVLAALVVSFAVLLAVSPYYRALYLGQLGARGESGAPPAAEVAPPPARVARVRTRVRVTVPTEDAEGRVRVPVADVVPPALPADGVPSGWDLKELSGRPDIELVRSEGRLALRVHSENSAFILYRDVLIDPSVQSRLTWSWKITRTPVKGDVRNPARNDQAVGIYVVFPRWPSPISASEVIGYIHDTAAPVGTVVPLPGAPNVRLLVVESGTDGLGEWRRHERDIVQDYSTIFGTPPGRVGKLAIMSDADQTHGVGEALVADLRFSRR
jgi:DUF3047 family protein